MRRTQPSAQANQRRNLLGPVRDRAITKPIPTNRSTASTGAGISRSERLVPHRSPPIDLTSDAEDDGERFSAAEEDEENENEGDEDEEDEYYDDEDVRVANASPGRANRLSTAKFCLVEERLCATSTGTTTGTPNSRSSARTLIWQTPMLSFWDIATKKHVEASNGMNMRSSGL
jgi:hypothetical protein